MTILFGAFTFGLGLYVGRNYDKVKAYIAAKIAEYNKAKAL